MNKPIIRFDNFSIENPDSDRPLIAPLNLTLPPYRTLALVGESGSGKTLLGRSILGLLPEQLNTTGNIYFQDKKIISVTGNPTVDNKQKKNEIAALEIRGKAVSFIMQNAINAFDPLFSLQDQFCETLQKHTALSYRQALIKAQQSVSKVKLSSALLKRLPSQLSGGQLQRMMLALTFALEPELVIADEPTSALDSLTQFELLPLFKQMAKERSMIFITHDLALVQELADDIAVLKRGEIVEFRAKSILFSHPQHPYTQYLLAMRAKLNQPFARLVRKKQ
ncbi:ATP-binding cassette domain-containing protein [Basfia succiniciproducens]|uniref:Nickel transport system ATP-binding protein n=1 Tax=Basfia succiniciproducens TaxID=653940 RepID=A0A1G5DF72_9PAST|nr:ABC transporter ATP-binding protein [Basfia succiniciproducens]QIM67930.1 DppD protein [Basfia succiniciproducens]SCY13181.1 nickel transport system ATP-binding protein [Basfia succiniciproducens]